MWTYNYTSELYHHGISGMRWGKRNGPPYPLSAGAHSRSERAAGTSDWSKEAKKEARKSHVDRAFTIDVKQNIVPAEKLAKDTRNATVALNNIRHKTKKAPADNRQEKIKSLSDEELRQRINRLDMEKRYMSLTDDEINSGKDYIDKFVDISNDVVTLALAVGGTIAMLQKIKGG